MAEGAPKPPLNDPSVMKQVAAMSGLGFEFLAAILLPGAVGYWLDGKWNTSPWLILIGGAFGFAVGLYRLLKSASKAMR
jgi:F0F1-type ATP synthase assembly protein I